MTCVAGSYKTKPALGAGLAEREGKELYCFPRLFSRC